MSAVDRAALIDAAAKAVHESYCATPGHHEPTRFDRAQAASVVDAVLPLIADAIAARTSFWGFPGEMAVRDAAELVRSLTGDSE